MVVIVEQTSSMDKLAYYKLFMYIKHMYVVELYIEI